MLGALVASPGRPADAQGLGMEQLEHMMAWGTGSLILFDQLEYAPGAEGRPLILDAIGWYGGAYNRIWFRAEGEQLTSDNIGEGEVQLAYGRLVTAYFDALVGVRVDQRWGEESGTRAYLAAGLQGLAPLRFEFSPTFFVSQNGDLSARLDAEYQLLITQRLVASPEIELNAALQDVPEWGVASGINDYGLGLRLRYEIRREFAPYAGYAWTRRVGGSADLARDEGEGVSEGAFVMGLRLWF
jgi:copper resistance protein B